MGEALRILLEKWHLHCHLCFLSGIFNAIMAE